MVYKTEEELLHAEIEELLCTLAWESNTGDPDCEGMFNYLADCWEFTQQFTFRSYFGRMNSKFDLKISLQRAINSATPTKAPVGAAEPAFERTEEEKSAGPADVDTAVAVCFPGVCEVERTSTAEE